MTQENILLTKIVADNAQFKAKISDSISAAKEFGEKVSKAFEKVKGILAGGLIGREVISTLKDGYESLDRMTASAERLGISADNFQYLEFAAKRSDVEIGSLENSIKKLRVSLADPGKANLFGQLGLSQAKLRLMDTGDALTAVYDQMKKLDEYKMIDIGTKMMGRNFQDTIALARQGVTGFKDELNSIGGPVDTSGFDALDKRVDQLSTKYDNLKKKAFLNFGGPLITAADLAMDAAGATASPIKSTGNAINSVVNAGSPRLMSAMMQGLTPMTSNQMTSGNAGQDASKAIAAASSAMFKLTDASNTASAALSGIKNTTATAKLKEDLGAGGMGGREYLSSILSPLTEVQDEQFNSLVKEIRSDLMDGVKTNSALIQSKLASLNTISQQYTGVGDGSTTNQGMLAAYELLKNDINGIKNDPGKVVVELKYDQDGIIKAFATSSGAMSIMDNAVRQATQKEAAKTMATGG